MDGVFKEDDGKWYFRTAVFDNTIYGPFQNEKIAKKVYDSQMESIHEYAKRHVETATQRLKDSEQTKEYFRH